MGPCGSPIWVLYVTVVIHMVPIWVMYILLAWYCQGFQLLTTSDYQMSTQISASVEWLKSHENFLEVSISLFVPFFMDYNTDAVIARKISLKLTLFSLIIQWTISTYHKQHASQCKFLTGNILLWWQQIIEQIKNSILQRCWHTFTLGTHNVRKCS